jgi:hypothetical protein
MKTGLRTACPSRTVAMIVSTSSAWAKAWRTLTSSKGGLKKLNSTKFVSVPAFGFE